MENFPIAEITGTSYEIGYQEGSLFKEKVAGTIQCYREMFKDYSNLEWERAKELSTRFIDVIREYNPDYLEEFRPCVVFYVAVGNRVHAESVVVSKGIMVLYVHVVKFS